MNVIVTCGPSYEPIDQVRRITNFSTGRLGITIANAFTDAGHHVICLKGEQATDPTPVKGKTLSFSTNDDLAEKLRQISSAGFQPAVSPTSSRQAAKIPTHSAIRETRRLEICDTAGLKPALQPADLILHAAALCDFKVASVQNSKGTKLTSAKFPTRSGELTLQLEPTTKILPQLRAWFPKARIIGWKYELEGTRAEAMKKAYLQIKQCKTDASVLNGAAYGKGFALVNSNVKDPGLLLWGFEAVEDNESLSILLLKRFGRPIRSSRR